MWAKHNLKRRQHLAGRPRRWLGWARALCHIIPSCHILCDYGLFLTYWRYAWILVHMMIFCQQNSWNSLLISTYLLYLKWNVGMLAVNICILWPPTMTTLMGQSYWALVAQVLPWCHFADVFSLSLSALAILEVNIARLRCHSWLSSVRFHKWFLSSIFRLKLCNRIQI
jgi:hypothetical protein